MWGNEGKGEISLLIANLAIVLSAITGIASVGVFSIGVAFSESVWTISRSVSVILYSDIVNTADRQEAIKNTKFALKISFLLSLVLLLLMIAIPSWVYSSIFGKDFTGVKQIILYLSPGILAIASSNIVGHYFSAINQLRILNIKSFVGLFFTLALSLLLIPKFGILGACIATSVSYIVSSVILFYEFYKTSPFHVSDFWLTKHEWDRIQSKLRALLGLSVKSN